MNQAEHQTEQQFFLDESPVVEWPVKIRVASAGGFTERAFVGRFRLLSESDYEAVWPKAPVDEEGKAKDRPLSAALAENAEILPKFLVGWDVKTASGEDVPIEKLPEHITGAYGRALSIGIWRAVNELRYGIDLSGGASLGNSAPLPAAGSK